MSPLNTVIAPERSDVVVIGAGVNGLAVAREAAYRGLSTVVLDRDDLSAQTSAISTRLIHGGLKYLERLELPLVMESIRERDILLTTAPHLVHPYPMLIPFARGGSRPGWLLACGLILHDVLSFGKRLPRNGIVAGSRLKQSWPSLAEGGLRWAGLFQDAHVPITERFAVELALDAQAAGATVLTHSPVISLLRENSRITGVRYLRRDGQQGEIRARHIVNAGGPWVDSILDLAGDHVRRIGPTKGSHLVVDAFPGAPSTCIFFESPDDARPMFVLPWQNGQFMIGTTDLPFEGSIEDISIDDTEVDYLLRAVNGLIPSANLAASDVLWSYSGVRPLPYVADLEDPSSVTRDSEIVVHEGTERGLLSIIGGKYTTHRALGEQVVRKIERDLHLRHERSTTRRRRFPGAPASSPEDFVREFTQQSDLPDRSAKRLAAVYGRIAERIESLAVSDTALQKVIDEDTGAIAAEIVYAVESEGAVTLEDALLRRTAIALNRDVGLTCAPVAAQVLVDRGIWSQEQATAELASYKQSIKRFEPRAYANQTASRGES